MAVKLLQSGFIHQHGLDKYGKCHPRVNDSEGAQTERTAWCHIRSHYRERASAD